MSQATDGAEAKPSAPFLVTLADGRKVDPTSGKVVADQRRGVEPPPSSDGPSRIVTRRTTLDMPVPTAQMRLIAAVAALEVWGLPTSDLAEVFGVDEEKLLVLKTEATYKNFFKQLVKSVLDSELEEVRDSIAATARKAANRIMLMLDEDHDSKTLLKACQDLLDRAGLRAADIVEHKHTMEGGFKIIYEKRGQSIEAAKDITFTEIKDG